MMFRMSMAQGTFNPFLHCSVPSLNTSLATTIQTSPVKTCLVGLLGAFIFLGKAESLGNKNRKVPTCPHVHQDQEASRCRCERPEGKHLPWLNIFVHPSSVGKAPGIAKTENTQTSFFPQPSCWNYYLLHSDIPSRWENPPRANSIYTRRSFTDCCFQSLQMDPHTIMSQRLFFGSNTKSIASTKEKTLLAEPNFQTSRLR